MADQNQFLSVVERLTHQFGNWLKHRQELSEMRRLSATEFDRIASELQVSRTDLDELVRRGPHAADELPRLLEALGISEANLRVSRRYCCTIWSAFVPFADRSASAIAISPPERRPRAIRTIVSTRRRSMN